VDARARRQAYAEASIALNTPQGELILSPDETCPGMEALLSVHGATTWVFLPLIAPDRKRPREKKIARRVRKVDRWLTESKRLDGILRLGTGGELHGVLVFDLPRRRAREVARKLGLRFFYWGARETQVELHPVLILDQDPVPGQKLFGTARAGLREFLGSTLELADGPLAQHVTRARVQQLVFLGLAACAAAAAVHSAAHGLEVKLPLAAAALRLLVHPALLPAIALGIALQRILPAVAPPGREPTQKQMQDSWQRLRSGLAGTWIVAMCAVLLLALPRFAIGGVESAAQLVEDLVWWLLLCLWLMPAIATVRGIDHATDRIVEALVMPFILWLMLKLAPIFAGFGTRMLVLLIGALVVTALPEWLERATGWLTALTAEVVLFATALGITWVRQRERVVLWASGELPDGR